MNLTHRQQPPGSNQCGQACVAIITGHYINQMLIRALLGKGKTSTSQLRHALSKFGFEVKPLVRCRPFVEFSIYIAGPMLCVLHWEHTARKHWVVIDETQVYDPIFGYAMDHPTYYDVMRRDHAYFTSYAPVVKLGQ
jgi:ABC-type bacteriocin/lantibiotic exporter with double-glycine peptidase domain